MELMPGEQIIQKFSFITLTTHRVRHAVKVGGDSQITSFFLSELCSCKLLATSKPFLLLLALAAGAFAIFSAMTISPYGNSGQQMGQAVFAGIIALVCLMGYFMSREKHLLLSTAGKGISVSAWGHKFEEIVAFIDAIETAKTNRMVADK